MSFSCYYENTIQHTDHGMTSNGNHGGNTNKETSAMFMFMDTYLPPRPVMIDEHRKEVQQIDLPVTLAMLMGVTIPQQSMGVVISSLFQEDELEHVRRVNRMQLMGKLGRLESQECVNGIVYSLTHITGTTNTRSHDLYELQKRVRGGVGWSVVFERGV